ncbi:MAG: thiamine pyrophosphate-binding protein [Leptospiraceae bacterium]|nr:thiamine pyrophosphate-binding protein [Leptospiraceae bacterium]MCK6382295.1 thiamine pyrophosphate-binding protein [Leptospiraceae bacterium]NUM41196.1 thiamine pyrophosphate-binding protein [Leptospiraceae bacterium]
MKKTGAELLVHALEEIGVKFTFGIPGVHNTEIYDELNKSKKITPILVTHECGGAFMADAISRTTDSIGTLVIVPAAGMTHALSGIGEAYLDGIPMLIISGGIRRDSGKFFQLHQIDQHKILSGITKKSFLVEKHSDVIPTIYEAFKIANDGFPGPVFVEIPVNLQLFGGTVKSLPKFQPIVKKKELSEKKILKAVEILRKSKSPGIFVGWGARNAKNTLIEIAEFLNAPVATTLQGLSVFPANHPLHTGMGFGVYSVPAGEKAFQNCDALFAIGARFSEIPTGSFGMKVPKNLIHVDIDPDIFDKNYKTVVSIEGDSLEVLQKVLIELKKGERPTHKKIDIKEIIRKEKESYRKEWEKHSKKNTVNPYLFFKELRKNISDDDIVVVDDGNHTFLTAELLPIHETKTFLTPSDFNSMGYCVPASIGAKLAHPKKNVVGIVGDGAFLMTGAELLTATTLNLGVVIFVFYDGELSQISQGQEIPYNRKTCSVLGKLNLEGFAIGTGASYLEMKNNEEISEILQKAFEISKKGQPVIVDVKIDYSKRTRFTKGVVKANLSRFPLGEKFRFIGRALSRKITG